MSTIILRQTVKGRRETNSCWVGEDQVSDPNPFLKICVSSSLPGSVQHFLDTHCVNDVSSGTDCPVIDLMLYDQ